MTKKRERKLVLGAIGGAAALLAYAFLIRPWHLRWGATDDEVNMPLPGDEFVEDPKLSSTHAITIHASAADVWPWLLQIGQHLRLRREVWQFVLDVWPWLLQIGQHRGGFYSYTWLENLVGCDMHNANRIVPEWLALKVGDKVWLHPKAPPLRVLAIEPGQAIVLEKCWTFFLHPIDENTTRLIIRGRGEFNPDLKNGLLNFFLWRVICEPAHFIMERKMLLGIKQRAENDGDYLKRSTTAAKLIYEN